MLILCIRVYIEVYSNLIINICPNTDILYTSKTEKLFYKNTSREEKMFKASSQKEVSAKLMKGMLDLILLQLLSNKPMHGYEVITKIRKNFGVYFGPSTIYPLLGTLEKNGYVDSNWNIDFERPRKVYSLTTSGQNMLNYTEDSLNIIRNKITNNNLEISQPTICMIITKNRTPLALEAP
jgi:PadR family transcriptional regulator PadR